MFSAIGGFFSGIGSFFYGIGSGIVNFFAGIVNGIGNIIAISISAEYLLPTLIAIVVMAIKLFINNRVCAMELKKCIIEMPCEILVLALGFAISNMSNYAGNEYTVPLVLLFQVIIMLIFTAAIINYLKDKIAKFNGFHISASVLTYAMALYSYAISVAALVGGVTR